MNIFRKEAGFSSSCLLGDSKSSKYGGAQWRKCCRRKALIVSKAQVNRQENIIFLCYRCKLSGCLSQVYFTSQTLAPKDPDWPIMWEWNVHRLYYEIKNVLNLSSGGMCFPKFSLDDASLIRIRIRITLFIPREMLTFKSLAIQKIELN